MVDLTKREKVMIGVIVSLLIIFVGIYINFEEREGRDDNIIVENLEEDNVMEYNNSMENSDIIIHISGAVKNPGIVELKEGDRLYHCIEKSGGLTDDADEDRINLSRKVKDEEKIYIPKIGEEIDVELDSSTFETTETNLQVNINTASKEELMTLSGIGEVTAEKIIEYREGSKFNKIEDLMEVPGIGEKKFEAIKDFITIN